MFTPISGTAESQEQLKESMLPVLKTIHTDINKANLINLPMYVLPTVHVFSSEFLIFIYCFFLNLAWCFTLMPPDVKCERIQD